MTRPVEPRRVLSDWGPQFAILISAWPGGASSDLTMVRARDVLGIVTGCEPC